jgi:hypothetical protein
VFPNLGVVRLKTLASPTADSKVPRPPDLVWGCLVHECQRQLVGLEHSVVTNVELAGAVFELVERPREPLMGLSSEHATSSDGLSDDGEDDHADSATSDDDGDSSAADDDEHRSFDAV